MEFMFFLIATGRSFTGKARKQNLWKEMTNAFNRRQSDIQKIRRKTSSAETAIPHLSGKGATDYRICGATLRFGYVLQRVPRYRPNDPTSGGPPVRSVANEILNKRMETFGEPKEKS